MYVHLEWQHDGVNTINYLVDRQIAPNGSWFARGSTPEKFYNDENAVLGTSYNYRITASGPGGMSTPSMVLNHVVSVPAPNAPTDLVAVTVFT